MSDMRAKYETLNVLVLKDLAKSRGIKNTGRMKKEEVIAAMLDLDKQDDSKAADSAAVAEQPKPAPRRGRPIKNPLPPAEDTSPTSDTAPAKPPVPENQPQERPVTYRSEQTTQPQERPVAYRSEHTAQPQEREVTERSEYRPASEEPSPKVPPHFDDATTCEGILEVLADGYGFIRSANYLPGDNDVYVSPSQIRRFRLKTGDILKGKTRRNNPTDKFGALLLIESMNGMPPDIACKRPNFEDLTPVFPDDRLRLERPGCSVAMRIVDLISPIGKGQRGMIVSQPKAGKTTLLKQVAKSIKAANPEMYLLILLIDERPEEVTDMKEEVEGDNCEVIHSTFDELPEHHKRVSEMVIERAKRLVEQGEDVIILLDSITRLARAYNLTVQPSGRTLSGGLDPAALHMPKRFFGAARNMREGGSLTILATALVETGSKMDDVVFEEFKGTGNMELVLDRKLSEKRVFPAIDLARSSTRREDLLLTADEREAVDIIRKALNGMKRDEAGETIINLFSHTKTNADFVKEVLRRRML